MLFHILCLYLGTQKSDEDFAFLRNSHLKDVTEYPWMKTKVSYTCDIDNSVLVLEDLNYPKSIDVECKMNFMFGQIFPYWDVPETNYPEKNEIFCAFPDECYNFAAVDPAMSDLNLTNTFDKVKFNIVKLYLSLFLYSEREQTLKSLSTHTANNFLNAL